MALAIQELDHFVNKYISDELIFTTFRRDPLFVRLVSNLQVRTNPGTGIRQPIQIRQYETQLLRDESTYFDISFIPSLAHVENQLRVYGINVTYPGYAEMMASGPLAVFDFVELLFLNAAQSMASDLARALYLYGQGDREGHTSGFMEWYDDGNNFPNIWGVARSSIQPIGTVGGLNAYTNTSVNTFSLEAINLAYVQAWDGPDAPDLIVCSPTAWHKIWTNLQALKRFSESDTDVADAGFQAFRFNGADVVVSRYLPPNTMYGINTNYVKLLLSDVKLFQFGFTGWKRSQTSINLAGQWLVALNLLVQLPRTGFKLQGTAL